MYANMTKSKKDYIGLQRKLQVFFSFKFRIKNQWVNIVMKCIKVSRNNQIKRPSMMIVAHTAVIILWKYKELQIEIFVF